MGIGVTSAGSCSLRQKGANAEPVAYGLRRGADSKWLINGWLEPTRSRAGVRRRGQRALIKQPARRRTSASPSTY